MPVYHIVLFRLKQSATQASINAFTEKARAMAGQVPGLLKIDIGSPLPITAARSKGFDMGVVAILEKPTDIEVYAKHPAHLA
ncbi:hypothetical protein SLS62_007039 [Diatrype stigma]|uniref:Stress-response A/B barrel domain-containing protein n=1 Tax=Diatrype stigma TaxID=117547 RepID=A0AAN9YMH7_9PEZI